MLSTNQNYLNIVYGSKSSHIDGKLEGGSNNIFLINPNGIVVGKGGSISANRVFLSASSIGGVCREWWRKNFWLRGKLISSN
ncbi:filamentous hemagglutinin N-terminal domain-containing protein [Campylobacter jejuni]